MKKYLWKFYWDCGRMGELNGLFVATEKDVQGAIGKEVYFGEVLGKHSEVFGKLEKEDIYKVDVEPSVVAKLIPHLGYDWSGFNPLNYIDEYQDEEEYDEEEED